MLEPTFDQLLAADPNELLAAFVTRFNDVTGALEEADHNLVIMTQERDGANRLVLSQRDEITQLTADLDLAKRNLTGAEDIAIKAVALKNENDKYKHQVKTLQQEITKMRGEGNPKRLREQIARIKVKDGEQKTKIKRLETEAKAYRRDVATAKTERDQAVGKVRELQQQLSHDTGSGLYHNGEHHLIIWPQKTKMQRPDGSIFEGRSLLYLHQSGRGGLMTFDPEDGTHLCSAPKGGLRPNKDVVEFANDWLFKVNMVQDGIVKNDDMTAVNYNPDLVA